MLEHRTKILTVLSLSAWLFSWGCASKNQEWVVLSNGLPEKISPELASRSVVYYILRQTHEPLFRLDDGENYSSRLLKKWGKNISDGSFEFCPDTTLKFNEENLFSNELFERYISGVARKYDASAKVTANEGCFKVAFAGPRNSFLEFLTQYENAPSVRVSEAFEQGLGPFRISRLGGGEAVLIRRIPVSSGYNKIILYEYGLWKKSGGSDRLVSDFNRIPPQDVPAWVSKKYSSFNNVTLKSGNLIINHPDRRIRELIYNCVDVRRFRQAFLPAKKDFYSIKTVFPMGVPGAEPGVAEQTCGQAVKPALSGSKFVFANWRDDNFGQLSEFAADFHKRTGVKMEIFNSTPRELMKNLHKAPRPFNAIVMYLDAIRSEQAAFFEVFLKSDGYLDFPLPQVAKTLKKLDVERDVQRRDAIGADIAAALQKEAVVLPLYQEERVFYYPKDIKNLNVGVGFVEYPEVADFKW